MAREALIAGVEPGVGSRSLLRRMNSWGILRAVLERPRTMRDLAAESGLSRTAIDAIISDLMEAGWVVASESSASGRLGRPAAEYQPAPGLGHFLALDIGANHIYAVVTDLTGHVRGHRTAATAESDEAEVRIATALRIGDELLESLRLTRADLWAVTIGSPGAISTQGEVLHFGGTGMPGWIGLDLRERFRRDYDAAVLVEGDVALGAQAELAVGAARGHTDVVYILCGARTSGASIVNGKVHRGVHGAAGIVGEMPELRWAELNEQYGAAVLGSPRPSREQIFDLARLGQPAAVEAVREFADDLATGAAAMTLAIDPELLVIGGGSSPSADVFLPRFQESLRAIVPLAPTVVASTLGSEAVAMGGISLAADRLAAVLDGAVRERESFPGTAETKELLRG